MGRTNLQFVALYDNLIICFEIIWICLFFYTGTEEARTRFQVELEFVQCLANPHYLNCKYASWVWSLDSAVSSVTKGH